MVEYLTAEQHAQRSGMAFFEADGRLDGLQSLLGGLRVRTMRDEVWVSALDAGAERVRDGRIFGLRVVVTSSLGPGEMRLWAYGLGDFLE